MKDHVYMHGLVCASSTRSACKKGYHASSDAWIWKQCMSMMLHNAHISSGERRILPLETESLYVEVLLIGCLEKERQFLLEYFWNQNICNTSVYAHVTKFIKMSEHGSVKCLWPPKTGGCSGILPSAQPPSMPPELLLAMARWWILLDLAQSLPQHIQTATNMNYLRSLLNMYRCVIDSLGMLIYRSLEQL